MIKTVTCSFSTIKRAADAHGIQLSGPVLPARAEADVVLHRVNAAEVAVRSRTLSGDLFLSLLVAGAVG